MISDEEWMEQARHGSRGALAELVERYHAPLVGYLYYVTHGQAALAEDLAQETFMKLIQHLGSYQAGRPVKPWLYAIATNLARDHFRRLETRKTDAWNDSLEEVSEQGEDNPELNLLKGEQVQAVSEAILQLNTAQRAVLSLRFYAGLSLVEISQTLDVPLGTVKSRLSNALRQLRRMLVPSCDEVPR